MNEELELVNALSRDHSRMRPSIVPSLLEAVQLNNRNEQSFTLFEIGRSYSQTEKSFSEEKNWFGAAFYSKKTNPVMDAVNSTEELLSHLNLAGRILDKPSSTLFPKNWSGLHPHEHLTIQVFGKEAGAILSIHPLLKSKLKIKGDLTIVLLDLSIFENNELKAKNQYKPLPKFPGSDFDCTVVISKDKDSADVLKPIQKLKIKEIVSTKIADIFSLNENEKTITIRTHFLDREKTLEGAFLDESKNRIVAALEKSGYPLKK